VARPQQVGGLFERDLSSELLEFVAAITRTPFWPSTWLSRVWTATIPSRPRGVEVVAGIVRTLP
jgi:hypothetical protein